MVPLVLFVLLPILYCCCYCHGIPQDLFSSLQQDGFGDTTTLRSSALASLLKKNSNVDTAAEDDGNNHDLFRIDQWPSNPLRRFLRQDSIIPFGDKEQDHHDDSLSFRGTKFVPRVSANLPHHWWQQQQQHDYDEANSQQQQQDRFTTTIPTQALQKTGTTICGVCGAHFCIIGADTRATTSAAGSLLVADPRAVKLHVLAETAVAAGAGTSGDLQHLCHRAAISLALQERALWAAGNEPRHDMVNDRDNDENRPSHLAQNVSVERVCHWLQQVLWENGGAMQANLIVGGIDKVTGRAGLYALHPHGSMDRHLPYTALGSGGHAAMSILESRYNPNLTKDQAIQLVKDAIAAGIANDLGSGSQIDICVLDATTTTTTTTDSNKNNPMQYIRSISPPEQLEASPVDVDDTRAGVNGFGNQVGSSSSMRILRRRTLYDPDAVRQREEAWRRVLDL